MLNIVIPMAGRDSRFARAGFTDPKPFIPVGGVPMVELVIRNLRPSRRHRFIFVCLAAHLARYGFRHRLRQLAPGCEIIGLPGVTDGAACSVLMAAAFIDNETPLLIANVDQWVNTDINAFLAQADSQQFDGYIMTLPARDPKWSYVQRDARGRVCRVVEKEVVSGEATTGIYYFRYGSDFCRNARVMIAANARCQGEFYVAPVYTQLYRAGVREIHTCNIGDGMHGLGTPEDLAAFLQSPALELALRAGQTAA